MIPQVPELWDGGYWYVVPAITEADEGGDVTTPAVHAGVGFTAQYPQPDVALIRLRDPITVFDADRVAAPRHRGRLRGR